MLKLTIASSGRVPGPKEPSMGPAYVERCSLISHLTLSEFEGLPALPSDVKLKS